MNFLEAMRRTQEGSERVRPVVKEWYPGYCYIVGVGMMDRPTLFYDKHTELVNGNLEVRYRSKDYVPTYFDFQAEWEVVEEAI